jgi:hypothetical protein
MQKHVVHQVIVTTLNCFIKSKLIFFHVLLNHEPRAGKQVPLLLNMEEDELALDKAIESGDEARYPRLVQQSPQVQKPLGGC